MKVNTILIIILLIAASACSKDGQAQQLNVDKAYGLVTVSVCNIRSSPGHREELVTQALMGTPLRVLDNEAGWLLVQTPDMYEGWVDKPAVHTLFEEEFTEWKKSDRIIYTDKTGEVYDDTISKASISDIVAGSIAVLEGSHGEMYRVHIPDGRAGYIKADAAESFSEWAQKGLLEEKLLECAVSFMGRPYLWGGTSVKAFDCSGFTRIVYLLNGIIIERDASQQFRHGREIAKQDYPEALRPGDLMFFGRYKEGEPHPTHVGMYIGDTEFIHSSGMVKVNSLDSTRHNYSPSRSLSYLGARRIIGAEKEEGIVKVSDHELYFRP